MPAALGLSLAGSGSLSYAIQMALGVIAWFVITVLILRSRGRGLGRQFSALLATITTLVHIGYVVLFTLSAMRGDRPILFLAFIGFIDLFLEMLFGIGLIIWAMEDTEARLAMVHARTVGETQRTKRRAQLDPLTEAHNRFFLEEIRPSLTSDQASGSIVLIDVDGLKTINDKEGHEEGDKAIWTVATAIKKLVRGNDFLIRWGGDEFLVILPEHGRGRGEEALLHAAGPDRRGTAVAQPAAGLPEVPDRVGGRDAFLVAGAVRRGHRTGRPRHVRAQEGPEADAGNARPPRHGSLRRERTDT